MKIFLRNEFCWGTFGLNAKCDLNNNEVARAPIEALKQNRGDDSLKANQNTQRIIMVI